MTDMKPEGMTAQESWCWDVSKPATGSKTVGERVEFRARLDRYRESDGRGLWGR